VNPAILLKVTKYKLFLIAGFLSFFWTCQSDMPEPLKEDGLGWQLSYEEETLLRSSNEMSFSLLRFLDQKYDQENLFFSPVGIGNGVGIALNVINNKSNIELKQFLGVEEVSDVEINKIYSQLADLFGRNKANNYFSNANSVWLNHKYNLNETVSNQLMAYYKADVEYLDFDKTKHVRLINNWASRRTGGQVRKIVSDLEPMDESYIINMMRLNPGWTFDMRYERADPLKYTNHKGEIKSVPAIKLVAGQYKIHENGSIRMIDIPYGDYKFRFTIVQSLDGKSGGELNELNIKKLMNYLSKAEFKLAEIILPEFRIDHELKLQEVFPELVLDQDNNNLQKNDINSISEFIHKTTIDVHRIDISTQGQENAGEISSRNYNNPVYVSNPFTFFIREKLTGAIIFVGKVNDPLLK